MIYAGPFTTSCGPEGKSVRPMPKFKRPCECARTLKDPVAVS